MILASDLGSGELFWFMLEFFLLFILILILFQVIGDLFRDHTMSGGVKALWIIFLVLLPPLAIIVYLIARGPGMQKRALEQQQAIEAQFNQSVKAATADPAGQIADAKALLDSGAISAEEFQQLKQKALSYGRRHRAGTAT